MQAEKNVNLYILFKLKSFYLIGFFRKFLDRKNIIPDQYRYLRDGRQYKKYYFYYTVDVG